MELIALGSSSAGNSWLVSSSGAALLVDAGLSAGHITDTIIRAGVSPNSVCGIVITHEHGDHVRSAGVLARRFRIPIYGTQGTLSAMRPLIKHDERLETFVAGDEFVVGAFSVHPFSIPHDASDPVGFVVDDGKRRLAVATDMGTVTNVVRERIAGVHTAVIEANHDRQMLKDGPYPWPVKQRIDSGVGHLNNPDGFDLMVAAVRRGVGQVVLAHLSRTNNDPRLVADGAKTALEAEGLLDAKCAVVPPGEQLLTFDV